MGGDVEGAFIGPRKGQVGGLSRHRDRAEIASTGVEDLNAGDGRDVQSAGAIQGDAIGDAGFSPWNAPQVREGAPVDEAAVRLNIEREDDVAEGIGNQQNLFIPRQSQPIGLPNVI